MSSDGLRQLHDVLGVRYRIPFEQSLWFEAQSPEPLQSETLHRRGRFFEQASVVVEGCANGHHRGVDLALVGANPALLARAPTSDENHARTRCIDSFDICSVLFRGRISEAVRLYIGDDGVRPLFEDRIDKLLARLWR